MQTYDKELAKKVDEYLSECKAYDDDIAIDECCKCCVDYCEGYLELRDTTDLILEASELNQVDSDSCLYAQCQRNLRNLEKEINKRGQTILKHYAGVV